MKQRGRKPGNLLTAAPAVDVMVCDEPLPAPLDLTPEQAEIWAEIVGALDTDWVRREAAPLLAQLSRHVVDARRLAQLIDQECARGETDTAVYIELLKAQRAETSAIKSLSTSLRLSPQATMRPETGMRQKAKRPKVKRPWED